MSTTSADRCLRCPDLAVTERDGTGEQHSDPAPNKEIMRCELAASSGVSGAGGASTATLEKKLDDQTEILAALLETLLEKTGRYRKGKTVRCWRT